MSKEHVDLSGLNSAAPKLPEEMLTPAAQATMAVMIREAVTSVFAQMAPLLKDVALTPEKIQLMEDTRRADSAEVVLAKLRSKREKQLMIAEQEENRKNREHVQAGCRHRYVTGQLAIQVVHNFPDRQPRGTCALCQLWIFPREWRIGAPTEAEPRGVAEIVPAHPQYDLVLEAAAQKQS